MAQHRHLGKDFKAGPAIEAIKGEKTNNEIASIYEIHPNQVGKWKKPALEKLRRTQIDQAVLAYQDVLWHHRERCEDSVKTQIWIAVSVYVPVATVKKELKVELSLGEILQILSIVLFEKVPVTQVLTKNLLQNEDFQFHNQLLLFDL